MISNSPSTVRTRSPPSTEDELRALFDLGGDILRKLFVTATEHQVAECRHWVEKVRTSNHLVVHTMNNLMTVVNHTYGILNFNRQHMRDIERYVSKLERHFSLWMRSYGRDIERQISFLDTGQRIDESISSLESIHTLGLRELFKFKQQRRPSLESGRLTEITSTFGK